MLVLAAATDQHWRDAAALLFAYHRETALEVGQRAPGRPEDVWAPVRAEALDPASVFSTYLLAVEECQALGGMALTVWDERSLMLKRCYVLPANRRKGVARALVAAAADDARRRDMSRLVLDILPSRTGAVTAWRTLGFVDAEPWGDARMVYLERPRPAHRLTRREALNPPIGVTCRGPCGFSCPRRSRWPGAGR